MSMIDDIIADIREVPVNRRKIIWFALILAAAATIIEWRWYDFRGSVAAILFGCSGLLLLIAAVQHSILVPVYRAWMGIAIVIGWFVFRALLIVTFFALIVPLRIVMSISRKDLMGNTKKESYWIPVEKTTDLKRYLKKF